MSTLPITLVVKNYDHIAPLACGDVVADDLDLTLDRKTPMAQFLEDPKFQAGEVSFSQYLIRLSQGDRRFVGIPIFPTRAFRHRCFLVRRGSELRQLEDLVGKRVGTNGWPDTGNTWSRAALRERGVDISTIDWSVGPVDDPSYSSFGHRPQISFPSYVQSVPEGRTLVEMLLASELDALMIPYPPKGFYDPDSPVVRLIPDFRTAEREYAARVGYYPAHHIIALKRDVFEQHPWVADRLLQAFSESLRAWEQSRLLLAETSPWLLADLEETVALFGNHWQDHGLEHNRAMIAALCEEEFAQKLVEQPIDPSAVFAEHEETRGR